MGRCRGARRGGEGVPKLPANTSGSSAVTRGAWAAAAPRCAGCAEGRPAGRIVFTHTWLFLAPARPAARPARGSQGSRRAVRTPPCRWWGRSRNQRRCQEGAAPLRGSLLGPHGHRCPSGLWVQARLSCWLRGLRPPREVVHGIAVNTVSASMVRAGVTELAPLLLSSLPGTSLEMRGRCRGCAGGGGVVPGFFGRGTAHLSSVRLPPAPSPSSHRDIAVCAPLSLSVPSECSVGSSVRVAGRACPLLRVLPVARCWAPVLALPALFGQGLTWVWIYPVSPSCRSLGGSSRDQPRAEQGHWGCHGALWDRGLSRVCAVQQHPSILYYIEH